LDSAGYEQGFATSYSFQFKEKEANSVQGWVCLSVFRKVEGC
jgi:hypothetical protein